jgi:hypothetical protein
MSSTLYERIHTKKRVSYIRPPTSAVVGASCYSPVSQVLLLPHLPFLLLPHFSYQLLPRLPNYFLRGARRESTCTRQNTQIKASGFVVTSIFLHTYSRSRGRSICDKEQCQASSWRSITGISTPVFIPAKVSMSFWPKTTPRSVSL